VGLSQAGVLHYFGSRDELLRAVLEHRATLGSGRQSVWGLAERERHPVQTRKWQIDQHAPGSG
jgi:AcrR family transcriptional regulator